MRYKISKTPRMTANHNICTWQKLEENLNIVGAAEFEQLVVWCRDHDHDSGGRGFVIYCIKNKWLESVQEFHYGVWQDNLTGA